MRYVQSAVSVALACGLVATSSASTSHWPHHHSKYSAATKEAGTPHSHHGTVPEGANAAHASVKQHKAEHAPVKKPHTSQHKSASLHVRPETQALDVA